MVDGHIKSVAEACASSYDTVEEAEANPAESESEVEDQTEVKPAEEAAPEVSAKTNGVTPAAEVPAEEPVSLPTEPSLSASQEWVDVQRPEETTSTIESTPAELTPAVSTPALSTPAVSTPAASQSWADDHPEATEVRLDPYL